MLPGKISNIGVTDMSMVSQENWVVFDLNKLELHQFLKRIRNLSDIADITGKLSCQTHRFFRLALGGSLGKILTTIVIYVECR
jgi:hypothetical protein